MSRHNNMRFTAKQSPKVSLENYTDENFLSNLINPKSPVYDHDNNQDSPLSDDEGEES